MLLALVASSHILSPFIVERLAVRSMLLNGENYRMEVFVQGMFTKRTVLILFRGDRVIWTKVEEGLSDVRRLWWPYSNDAFEIKVVSYDRSFDHSQIYRVDGDQVIGPLLEQAEKTPGGPVYRDINGDGRVEMIYDNYDFHAPEGTTPDKLIVFQVDSNLRITPLKTLPNSDRIRLPYWTPANTIGSSNTEKVNLKLSSLPNRSELFVGGRPRRISNQ